MKDINVDDFTGRKYQQPLWDYMMGGGTRAVAVWHRRAGKDVTALDITRRKAFKRVGNYFHCFPEYSQGRKVLWDGIDGQGNRFIKRLTTLAKSVNKQEMKIELLNGSIWQIIGADNYDSVVGGNPVGIVFSEWAISDKYPDAWNYFRPMLVENGGWGVWIYTPRGMNHGFELYSMATHNPDWFCQLLSVEDTKVVSKEDIEAERRAGMGEDMIQQEFYCSFIASTANILIPYELIQAAMERKVDYPNAKKLAGCDVARFGDDRTALVCRRGGIITHMETWQGLNAIQVAGKLKQRFDERYFDAVAVDAIGVGAGVADLVSSYGIPTIAVNVAETSSNQDRFHRLRDELWWKAREWFADKKCALNGHPLTPKLVNEIQAVTYDYKPTGQIVAESKDSMKERLGFSPDLGDAFCLTFANGLDRARRVDYQNQERAIMDFDPLGV
jgi:hypothetical protein